MGLENLGYRQDAVEGADRHPRRAPEEIPHRAGDQNAGHGVRRDHLSHPPGG